MYLYLNKIFFLKTAYHPFKYLKGRPEDKQTNINNINHRFKLFTLLDLIPPG